MTKCKGNAMTLWLPKDLKKCLKDEADKKYVSMSKIIREMLLERYKEQMA